MKKKQVEIVSKDFNIVVERDSSGYLVGSVLELPGCHTQAKSLDTLMKRMREAIDLYLEEQGAKEEPTEFVGIYRISL